MTNEYDLDNDYYDLLMVSPKNQMKTIRKKYRKMLFGVKNNTFKKNLTKSAEVLLNWQNRAEYNQNRNRILKLINGSNISRIEPSKESVPPKNNDLTNKSEDYGSGDALMDYYYTGPITPTPSPTPVIPPKTNPLEVIVKDDPIVKENILDAQSIKVIPSPPLKEKPLEVIVKKDPVKSIPPIESNKTVSINRNEDNKLPYKSDWSTTVKNLEDYKIQNLKDYIILPGRRHGNYEYPDLLVSKTIGYKGDFYSECEKNLHKEKSFMLTLRQFVDFLYLIKKGSESKETVYCGDGTRISLKEASKLYNEITSSGLFKRDEWLDATLWDAKRIWYHEIRYNSLVEVHENLDEHIGKWKKDNFFDKGMDLTYYLNNANNQGFPLSAIDGNLNYKHPKAYLCDFSNIVFKREAIFNPCLDCDHTNSPSPPSDSRIWVRPAKIRSVK